MLKMHHSLRYEWCKEIQTKVQWENGKGTRGKGREGIDKIQAAYYQGILTRRYDPHGRAGAYGAKTNCLYWPVEKSNTVHPGNNINNPYETTTSIPAVRWEVEGLFH